MSDQLPMPMIAKTGNETSIQRSGLRFNEHFFDEICSEPQAYWLGFVLADGCVLWNARTGNYALQVGLGGRDIEHLQMLEHDMEGSRTPVVDPRNGTVRLLWYSKYLAQRLIDLGIQPRKSANEHLPSFPVGLAQHFWRGVFDGDGSLTAQTNKAELLTQYHFSLAGSTEILEAFQAWAISTTGIRRQRIGKAKNSQGESRTYVFYVGGNRQVAAVSTALYHNCTRKLERKYAVYCALLEQNARTRPSFLRTYTQVE